MSSSDPSYIPQAVTGAVAAVVTIASAVPMIDKRLGRVSDVEGQLGRLPTLVQGVYVNVQRFYRWALLALTIVGVVSVLAFVFPAQFSHPVFEMLRQKGTLLIAIWLVVGAATYTNLISRVLVGGAWLLSWPLPIRRLLGIHRLDRNPSWQALRAFIDLNENAKPLVLDQGATITFADNLIGMLHGGAPAPNRAVPPARPDAMTLDAFRIRLTNALLAGCLIEEAHYEPGTTFAAREWGPYYTALGRLAIETDLFDADTVCARSQTPAYFSDIVTELNQRLSGLNQPPVHYSAELTNRLEKTLVQVARDYHGKAVDLDPGATWSSERRLEMIYDRIAQLPVLKNEGMRAQFVKLAVVWELWSELHLADFEFPFSSRVAALLMDRGVIAAPDDVKVLKFDRPEERQVQRNALSEVVGHASELVESRRAEHETWLPAPSKGKTGNVFRWWVAYELDFRIWDYAQRLHGANAPAGDALTRWKYTNSQVARVTK